MKQVFKFKRIILYNLLIIIVLLSIMELATRTISWISGSGFTLSIHEVDPFDKKIRTIYKWHPFVGFTFSPNNRLVGSHPNQKQKVDVFVDKHGFLAKDNGLSIKKETDEIRIATIGGSTTANLNLAFDQNWPGYLGILIQRKFPNRKIKVINAGIPGFDTAQSIGNLALRVMPFKPDIVIIYHAYNDLKAIRSTVDFKPDYSHIHNTSYGFHKQPNMLIKILSNSMLYVRTRNLVREIKQNKISNNNQDKKRFSSIPKEAANTFEEHIKALVAIARSGGASVIISSYATLHDPNLNWESPKEAIKELSKYKKDDLGGLYHFTPGLTIRAIFDGFNLYNEILHGVALNEKTGWVDNANLVPHEDQYFVDRVHFTPLGAKLMAENFATCVERIIVDTLKSEEPKTMEPSAVRDGA
jgi:lysophospholipase L1-like esterase